MRTENAETELRSLLASFENAFPPGRISHLLTYIDYGEPMLAIRMLSDWILEEHVPVNAEQAQMLRRTSAAFQVPVEYHPFIGRTPPYTDWATPAQMAARERLGMSLSDGRFLNVVAVQLHQGVKGMSLREARLQVDRLNGKAPKWWQFWKKRP